MTPRLSVAPRPLLGETVPSWVERIAARHRLAPAEAMDGLVPGRARGWWKAGGSGAFADAATDAALASAAGLPLGALAALRDPAAAVWPRRGPWPPWCPGCVRDDLERRGEIHERAVWRFGGSVLCPAHGRALVERCPICDGVDRCRPRRWGGRLRLFCDRCGDVARGARPASGPGGPGARGGARPDGVLRLHLGGAALAAPSGQRVVLALQENLLAAARDCPPVGPLSLGLPGEALLELVAALVPLVQRVNPYDWRSTLSAHYRPARPPADHRTPGRLGVDRALSALAAVGALLADAAGDPREDIVWLCPRSELGTPVPVRLGALVASFAEPQRGAFAGLARRIGGAFAAAVSPIMEAHEPARHRRNIRGTAGLLAVAPDGMPNDADRLLGANLGRFGTNQGAFWRQQGRASRAPTAAPRAFGTNSAA